MRRLSALMLSAILQQRLALPKAPAIIAAPPSDSAEYPAMAIWIEHMPIDWQMDEEIQRSAGGVPLLASAMDISLLENSHTVMLDAETTLSRVGMAHCEGRIFIGARLPAQREDLEQRVINAFCEDRGAPSRLLLTLEEVMINDRLLPFPWTVAAFLTESQWTSEYAFGERLWSWIKFELDLDMLVSRNDPIVNQLKIAFTTQQGVTVNAPSDLPNLTELKTYDVSTLV